MSMITRRSMLNSHVRSEPSVGSKRDLERHARANVSWTASSALVSE
jgi:hypothetical protein